MQLTGSSSLKHVPHLGLGIRSQPFHAPSEVLLADTADIQLACF